MSLTPQSDASLQTIAGSALSTAQRSGAIPATSLPAVVDSPLQGSPMRLPSVRTLSQRSMMSPLQASMAQGNMTPLQTPSQGGGVMLGTMTPLQAPMTPLQASMTPLQASMTPLQVSQGGVMTPLQASMNPLQISQGGAMLGGMTPLQASMSQGAMLGGMTPLQASMTPLQVSPGALPPPMSPLDRLSMNETALLVPTMTPPMMTLPPVVTPSPMGPPTPFPSPVTLGSLPNIASSPLSSQIDVAPSPMRTPSVARSLFPAPTGTSYAEAISGNYDNELMKNGYTKLDTVTIDAEGGERALYVKAYNVCGDICYIDVTKPSSVTVQMSNRTRVRAVQGTSSVNAGTIASTQECVGNSLCGLAFDCENGFCVSNKGDDGKSYTRTYTMVEEPQKRKVVPFGSPVAYPIITIDEIVANNENCIERVRKATAAIQERAMVESVLTMNELYNMINRLNGSVRPPKGVEDPNLQVACVGNLNAAYARLQTHRQNEQIVFLNVLQQLRAKQAKGMACAQDLENMKRVTQHLYGLNVECARLLNMINSFSMMKKKIHHLLLKTEETYWSMFVETTTNVFQTANARNEDGSLLRDTRSARVWGLPPVVDTMSFDNMMQGSLGNAPQTREVTQLNRLLSGYATPGGQPMSQGIYTP